MDDGFRASDSDRDRAAALLRDHFAAGRLTPPELDDRLTMALGATTAGDLRRALACLPEPAPARGQDGSLERGYRRLLAFYPAEYRRVHAEEMLAVLMTAAPDGQRRPGLAETADLIAGALRVWCQPSRGGMAGWRATLALVGTFTTLGLLAGIAFAAVNPPLVTSTATVAIQPSSPGEAYSATDTNSRPVLERAAHNVSPAISLQALQRQVQISHASGKIVVISARAATAAQAARTASVVAQSYISFVSGQSVPGSNEKMHPELLYVSSTAPRISLSADVLDTGGSGALWGAMIGAAGAVALGLPRRRYRLT